MIDQTTERLKTAAATDALNVRVAGESGEGVISAGEMLSLALARTGYEVLTFRTYPAEIRGGPCMFQVRFGSQRIYSQGSELDVLIAMNDEAITLHQDQVRPGGLILYDGTKEGPRPSFLRTDVEAHPVPFTEIAANEIKNRLSKNMVVLGATYAAMGLDLSGARDIVLWRFKSKGEAVVEVNIRALEAGHRYAEQELASVTIGPAGGATSSRKRAAAVNSQSSTPHILVSGNQALAIGAIAAGCRYYAGYPITPASDIMEYLANNLPKFGGVVLQAEDEISALSSCLGASFAGARAMTATSGPGLSLMTELIGLAVMAELPVVVVDVQRSGPSTGMPTKTEQGDFNLAVYGGHGDAPRVVLAPTSVEDCFTIMGRAFDVAERYQTPVIVLSELVLAYRTERVPKPKLEVAAGKRLDADLAAKLAASSNGDGFRRYLMTETGVSPRTVAGEPGGLHVITGLEHDEFGHPNYQPETHRRMSEKRFQKLRALEQQVEGEPERWVARFGHPEARIGLLGWGSTFGSALEASMIAAEEGIAVKGLWPKVLSPLPSETIRRFAQSVDVLIIPELNFEGQFAKAVAPLVQEAGKVVRLDKVAGLPFEPGEIWAKIREVAER